ncbi:MAG: FAD-dependent oxidoreductase, partial [Myxococcota bacterium]
MSRIAIVGGGFAGVATARTLRRRLPSSWEIVVYSRENHLCFSPLLPEVVGSSLNPMHVVWSIREMLKGVVCRTTPVTGFDLDAHQVRFRGEDGSETSEDYDHLVIAAGLPVRLEIIDGMGDYGWPIKTLGDAAALRNHLIAQLERAELAEDTERKRALLSVAVVGGGFTGVEVAGAILDLLLDAAPFYSRIRPEETGVHLLEGGPRILAPLSEKLSAFAHRKLEARGMHIHTGVGVEGVDANGLHLAGGARIEAGTVISAVGNGVHPLIANSGLALSRGRLQVNGAMQVEGHDDVWALGDCAAVPNAADDSISPTLAQFASPQGQQLAKNLEAVIAGRPPQPFQHRSRGLFCLIGHRNAVGEAFG